MGYPVTLIQGGGTGIDQARAVQRIVNAAGVEIDWEEHLAGRAALDQGLQALEPALFDSVRKNGRALKTRLFSPVSLTKNHEPSANYNVQFREELGLFASVRHLKNLRGLNSRFRDIDILVIRELTQDLYAAIEHEIVPGVVQSLKVVTKEASERFFRFAFQWTKESGRNKVHVVHKANILKLADGLVLEAFREIAKEFPDIETHEIIVDNCCMQMVSRPQQFDVMMMGNLYGDLVSDLGAGLVGGASVTAGINVGDQVRVYESFRGATHKTIGHDHANPIPLLLPTLDLLHHLDESEAAARILNAIEAVMDEGVTLTAELGGKATTSQMTDAIIARL